MAITTKLSKKDLKDGENFLVQLQAELVPEASTEEGSAIRDLLIKGFAAIYAYLRGEVDAVYARSSLKKLQELAKNTNDPSLSMYADELLSNWFVHRKAGRQATGVGRFYFTQRGSFAIPLSTQFWRTMSEGYFIDSQQDPYIITERTMFPLFGTDGFVKGYVASVPLKAARPGAQYDKEPGTFIRIQSPVNLPFLSEVTHTEAFRGGKSTESTEELIERSETAISVRNLINNRSNDVVLRDLFSEIANTMTVGFGEPELKRDFPPMLPSTLNLHIGSKYDTYVDIGTEVVEEDLIVGGFFPRADGVISVFRDPELTIDQSNNFISLGVKPGHILNIRSGLPGSPRTYVIQSVNEHEIFVNDTTPFTAASDELDANNIVYSIGWLSPGFAEIPFNPPTNNVFYKTAAGSVTDESIPYGTSRRVGSPGCVYLRGNPVIDILDVELLNPDADMAIFTDPGTHTIIFHTRINVPPQVHSAAFTDTKYCLKVINYEQAQSKRSINQICIGFADDTDYSLDYFDGKILKVRYLTGAGISSVHQYVTDRNNRVACADQLVRMKNPVWVRMEVPYKSGPNKTPLNREVASKLIIDLINDLPYDDTLDISYLMSLLRSTYAEAISSIHPFEVYYTLVSPDGQLLEYKTTDSVSVINIEREGIEVVNKSSVKPLPSMGISVITTNEQLEDYLYRVGVSNRVIKYYTREGLISFRRI
jgi:hypothetical protein